MVSAKSSNPFAFTPMSVILFVTVVYLAITIPLLVVHETVPPAPKSGTEFDGLNITEAWLDLDELSNGYHPFNSHRNDEVRDWLLRRIGSILDGNGVDWSTVASSVNSIDSPPPNTADPAAVVFNDLLSNVTSSNYGPGQTAGQSVYFEGTNIMVYIRGTEDDEGEWWSPGHSQTEKTKHGKGGVLVNAHYDSVASGYGATDDGVGVVSVLQLIKYFTTSGNRPRRGVVALLNNGEEDYLNGARAYTQHALARFAHTFLNLEGAGAGGRATLFRSTDAQVTRAYARSGSHNPFGSVVSADAFRSGFIRSQTDYKIFQEALGLRGLDLAFWYPRARYHTDQDDARHTSVDSLWHMLSAAVATMRNLADNDESRTFDGPRGDGAKGKVRNGKGSDGVWFDLFGKGFVLFQLHSLFAWSLVLLIAGPLVLMLVTYLLIRNDKYYFFAHHATHGEEDEENVVELFGWRGAFAFPAALIAGTSLTFGSAFLVNKVNPLIIYSSPYAVWSMMLALCFIVVWFVCAFSNAMRPSALQRGYSFLWMFVFGWMFLVAATVLEDRYHIGSLYFIVFFESTVFLAALISLLELFALPTKTEYAQFARGNRESQDTFNSLPDSNTLVAPSDDENTDEPSETTPLVGGNGHRSNLATTFAHYARRSIGRARDDAADADAADDDDDDANKAEYDEEHKCFGSEQRWSGRLPTWTWLPQFLLVAPLNLVLAGQIGLFFSFASGQTGSDGNATLTNYLIVALFAALVLAPAAPFAHRFTPHVPAFLLLVFVGSLAYNLAAFPFSAANRYKVYFQQTVDLDSGVNRVALTGLEDFVRPIIAALPSAAGQHIGCEDVPGSAARAGLQVCSWHGLPPRVLDGEGGGGGNLPGGVPPEKGFGDWLSFDAVATNTTTTTTTREGPASRRSARLTVRGRNTRACALAFARPIRSLDVRGGARAGPFEAVPEAGSSMVRLWHREWDRPWTVDVEWEAGDEDGEDGEARGTGSRGEDGAGFAASAGAGAGAGMEGRVICLWSDVNRPGVIPAWDELVRFIPTWAAATKLSDGLVEGSTSFVV